MANTTNPCASRQEEVIRLAAQLGRPLMIVTDGTQADFGVDAVYTRVPHTQTHITMPLTQFVPCALLAGYLAEELGEEYGRACEGPWSFAAGGAGVQKSEIVIRKDVLA